MYEDTYKKFDPNAFEYGEYKSLKIQPKSPYFEWDYGDTFDLEFKLGKKALLKNYDVYIYIYNFRHDLIYETSPEEIEVYPDGTIKFYVDQELSIKLIQGTYQCQVIIGDEEEQETIIRAEDCTLYVR